MLFIPPQSRHPERSAARIYRITDGLWRAVEGPRRCLLADALPSFPATNDSPNRAKPARSLPGAPRRFIVGLPSILPWRGSRRTPSILLAYAVQARFTSASPASPYPRRYMQHSRQGTWAGFTAACKRLLSLRGLSKTFATAIAREKQLKGWRRRKEAQPHSHHQSRVQRPCTDLGDGKMIDSA